MKIVNPVVIKIPILTAYLWMIDNSHNRDVKYNRNLVYVFFDPFNLFIKLPIIFGTAQMQLDARRWDTCI